MRSDDGRGYKYLRNDRLVKLLKTLPPDIRLAPNSDNNLLIVTSDGKRNIGVIDFLFDEIELVEEAK